MTVIAWDGTILAADKLSSNCGLSRTSTKIRRIRGMLCGAAGNAHLGREMMLWLEAGADPDKLPPAQRTEDTACTVICITPDRRILSYWTSPIPTELEEKSHAIGCGRDFAIATMALGFDAIKAVEIASRFSVDCGNGIDTLTLAE